MAAYDDPNKRALPAPGSFFTPQQNWAGNLPTRPAPTSADVVSQHPENTGYGLFSPSGWFAQPGYLQRASKPVPGIFDPNPNAVVPGNIVPNIRSYFSGGSALPAPQTNHPGGLWNWLNQSPSSIAAGQPVSRSSSLASAWNWLNQSPNSIAASKSVGAVPGVQPTPPANAAIAPQATVGGGAQPNPFLQPGPGPGQFWNGADMANPSMGQPWQTAGGNQYIGEYGATPVYAGSNLPSGRLNQFADQANIATLQGGRAAALPAPMQSSQSGAALAAPAEAPQQRMQPRIGFDGVLRYEPIPDRSPQGLANNYMQQLYGEAMALPSSSLNAGEQMLANARTAGARKALGALLPTQYAADKALALAQYNAGAERERAMLPWTMGATPEQQATIAQKQADQSQSLIEKMLPYTYMTEDQRAKQSAPHYSMMEVPSGDGITTQKVPIVTVPNGQGGYTTLPLQPQGAPTSPQGPKMDYADYKKRYLNRYQDAQEAEIKSAYAKQFGG